MLRVGVIGYGYWGPNIVRNFQVLDNARVVSVCDKSTASLARAKAAHPEIHVTTDCSQLLRDPDIDAIAVITPVWTHYELARGVLRAGKHLFVEKPFTSSSREAQELIELADRKGLTIMVDHTFLFTGAVQEIKKLIDTGHLGELKYYDSTRVNLGLFQHDVDVLWDLAPHDLSIVDYLIGQTPDAVVATGAPHINGNAYVAFMTAYFPNDVIAHINVNWLSPVKIRTTLIGGEKKMLVWNDLEADEKIKIYDKGVDISTREGVYDLLVSYRSGDMWSPKLDSTEALRAELKHFVECIDSQIRPINDGNAGLRVVQMLEAAQHSLKRKGEAVAA